MLMWILAIGVYAFFIYGLFEFFRNAYCDIGKHIKDQKIQVLITNNEEAEYLVRILKKEFNKITVILTNEDDETREILKRLAKDVEIEIENLNMLSENEKS